MSYNSISLSQVYYSDNIDINMINGDDDNVSYSDKSTWYQLSNARVNRDSKNRISVLYNDRNVAPYKWLKINFTSSGSAQNNNHTIYYKLSEYQPTTYSSNSDTLGGVVFYDIDYKFTYLYLLMRDTSFTSINNEYKVKRNNILPWNPSININDEMVERVTKNSNVIRKYATIDLSTKNNISWSYAGILKNDPEAMVPLIQYYVFADDGDLWLLPVMYYKDTDNDGGVYFSYGSYTENIYSQNSIKWLNNYASQKATSGFIGKFFGPNLQFLWLEMKNNVLAQPNQTKTFNVGKGSNGGNVYARGFKYRYNMFNTEYDFELPFNITNGNTSANGYTFSHLQQLKIGMYNNIFDFAKLSWCEYSSTNTSTITTTNRIGFKIIGTIIKTDGIYCLLTNLNTSIRNYINYNDKENFTWYFGNQLPLAIDSYQTWYNDNGIALNASRTQNQISNGLGMIGSILGSATGVLSMFMGSNAGLGQGVGSAWNAISGGVNAGMIEYNYNAKKQQAAQKYNGNIQGDGTDFSYYALYLSNTDTGEIYYNNRLQGINIEYYDDKTKKAIDDIVYYYGFEGDTYLNLNTKFNLSHNKFGYFQFDTSHPLLKQKLNEYIKKYFWPTIFEDTPETIYNYLNRKLSDGIRLWN